MKEARNMHETQIKSKFSFFLLYYDGDAGCGGSSGGYCKHSQIEVYCACKGSIRVY